MGVQSELNEPIFRRGFFPDDVVLRTELHPSAVPPLDLYTGALVDAARSGQQVWHTQRR